MKVSTHQICSFLQGIFIDWQKLFAFVLSLPISNSKQGRIYIHKIFYIGNRDLKLGETGFYSKEQYKYWVNKMSFAVPMI